MPILLGRKLRTALGLALDMWGCLGGLTIRRGPKRGAYLYYERPKQGPLSPAQLAHRVRFQRGYDQWHTLTADQMQQWRIAADRFTTRMVGSHLFLRVWWHQDQHFLDQALRWYNLTLELPGR